MKVTLDEIIRLIKREHKLLDMCLEKLVEKRPELINYKVEDLNINLGMVFALGDSSDMSKKDFIYATTQEKFVRGTSTSFGFLREAEVKYLQKKHTHHIFRFETKNEKIEKKVLLTLSTS